MDEFKSALEKVEANIQASMDIDEIRALHHRDTATAIGDKLIRGLMQLNSRDDAEAWAAKIDVSGIGSKYTRSKTVRNAADFYQLIGKDVGVEVIHELGNDGRAFASPLDHSISLAQGYSPKSLRSIQFHEMAHHTEFQDVTTGFMAKQWIQSRSEGEPKSLSELTGDNYKASETAFPDKFIHPYVGKLYSGLITEVHSMGLQCFADGHSVVELFKKDPDHFNLMIRYIRIRQ